MPDIGDEARAYEIGLSGYYRCVWLPCPVCGVERWASARKSYTSPAKVLCVHCSRAKAKRFKVGRAE